MVRQVRHGAASSRKARLVPVRQVRRDKVGHGEVRQVWHGLARFNAVRYGRHGTVWMG